MRFMYFFYVLGKFGHFEGDVERRRPGAHNQHPLPLKGLSLAVVVAVHYSPLEGFRAL